MPQDCIIVDIQPSTLRVVINTPEYDPFEKVIELFYDVDPAGSSYQ